MAKQTFTTGSVLTATQMNDLQTNDFNQTVSQKTASYVLVAADKGTRIEMNAAGATTVTVNTGLFNAGDTLFIQNIGAGACTVTAGTATVNKATAGSLTLAQYQGGTLYFVSASSAIFFADAGYTPPLTTKGDLFGYDTAAARIPIGTNDQVLTADSTQALGLKWATPASGGMTQLFSGSLSSTSTSIGTIATTYTHLCLTLRNPGAATAGNSVNMRINSTSSIYSANGLSSSSDALNATNMNLLDTVTATTSENGCVIWFWDYANTATSKHIQVSALNKNAASTWYWRFTPYYARTASAITSIQIEAASNLSGTYVLWGVK